MGLPLLRVEVLLQINAFTRVARDEFRQQGPNAREGRGCVERSPSIGIASLQ
jgi:hypothetical protein